MAAETSSRKKPRPRVNFPLAVPLEEAALIERAYEITGESRNAFCIGAAVARARDVIERAEREERVA